MKMKVIAIAVATAIPASMVSAITIFENEDSVLNMSGRAEVRGNMQTTGDDNSFQDRSRVRLGLDGKQKLSDNVSFFGKYEFELTKDQVNHSVDMNTRYLYVGAQAMVMFITVIKTMQPLI